MHNTCEDSLLAAPIILDLVIVAELLTRISLKEEGKDEGEGERRQWSKEEKKKKKGKKCTRFQPSKVL